MAATVLSSPTCAAPMAIASARSSRDDTRAVRALVRGRDDLVAQRVALAHQLRAVLERFWPGAAGIFADVDSLLALAFLARYPTP
jgi:transposase